MGLKILNIFINTLALAIICLLFFLSLDSFTEHKSLSENLTAFAIHNLPTIFISLICVAGLNKPLIGSFGFTIGASIYICMMTRIFIKEGIGWKFLPGILLFCFLPLLIAFLYLLKWFILRKNYINKPIKNL